MSSGYSQYSQVGTQPEDPPIRYKYNHLNLAVDVHGEVKNNRLLQRHRYVNMYWWEKVVEFLQFLQFHGFLFVISKEWPFPDEWLEWMRWVLSCTFDLSTMSSEAGFSFEPIYWELGLCAVPLIILAVQVGIDRNLYASSFEGNRDVKHRMHHLTFLRICYIVWELWYLPALLLIVRVFHCEEDVLNLLDNETKCWSGSHTLLAACSFPNIVFLVIYPIVIYRRNRRVIVFRKSQLHERYLRCKEIEYLMGVNSLYETTHFTHLGSYTRAWAHNKVFVCIQKIVFIVIWVFSSSCDQSILLTVAVLVPTALKLPYPCHRVSSTNWFCFFLDLTLITTCSMGLFLACGMESAFLVASTLTRVLAWTQGFGVFFAILPVLVFRIAHKCNPSKDVWPSTQADVKLLLIRDPEVVEVLDWARALIDQAETVPHEFFPRHYIVDTINHIREIMDEMQRNRYGRQESTQDSQRRRHKQLARAINLRFVPPETDKLTIDDFFVFNPLEWTLQDVIEELALLHNGIKKQYTGDHERMRHAAMFQETLGWGQIVQEKDEARILMRPVKRQFLRKLLVLRGLLGQQYFEGKDSAGRVIHRSRWASHGSDGPLAQEKEDSRLDPFSVPLQPVTNFKTLPHLETTPPSTPFRFDPRNRAISPSLVSAGVQSRGRFDRWSFNKSQLDGIQEQSISR